MEALSFWPRADLNRSNGCFGASLGLLFALISFLAGQSRAQDGSVEGLVTYRGTVPRSAVTDELGVARELLHVDLQSRGLQYVMLWIDVAQAEPRRIPPAAPAPNRGVSPVRVNQEDYAFVPRLIAIRSGQSVTFTTNDTANHNVHASSSRSTNEFNVFTGSGQPYTHNFTADPDGQPVRLHCDIHPWMRGWIYVLEHPFFAVSNAQGRFRISGVPPGRHMLKIRQPDISYADDEGITVKASEVTRVEIQVTTENLHP